MLCVEPECRSHETHVTRTEGPEKANKLPKDYRGLNIKRRHILCKVCGCRFTTIEIEESEFNRLKRPPGRLATPFSARIGGTK